MGPKVLSRQLQRCLTALESAPDRLLVVTGNLPVTANVCKVLPQSTVVTKADQYGESNIWYVTGCIEAYSPPQVRQRYFVKYATGDFGKALLAGEYYAMLRLAQIFPETTPRPLGWGNLQDHPNEIGYFYVSQFVEMTEFSLPPLSQTAIVTARLHRASMGISTAFGSPMPMYDGLFCHVDSEEDSWQKLFVKMLLRAWWMDRTTNEASPDIDDAMASIVQYVIPRLLGALEQNGRSIQPCFIHGDLYEGNIRVRKETNDLVMFDSNGYFAHNEMDLALWRTKHHLMHAHDYCAEYFKHIQPSHPAEEADDRIRLYGLKALLMYSATERGHITRQRAYDDMKLLILKYPPHEPERPLWSLPEVNQNAILSYEAHHPAIIDLIEDLRPTCSDPCFPVNPKCILVVNGNL